MVRLRLSTNAIRTVEFHGGLDAYLLSTSSLKLTPELIRLKKIIRRQTKAPVVAS
jgi:large subunit ribosomal protein L28